MAQQIPPAAPRISHGAGSGLAPGSTCDGLRAEQAALSSTDLTVWIALRRVNEGGVEVLEGSYYHHGRPVPEYLNTPLTELVEAGYLSVAQASPGAVGMHWVRFTQEGRDRYAVLCGIHRVRRSPGVPVS